MDIKCKCIRCHRTGELTEVDDQGVFSTITCPDCSGEGLIDWGDMADIVNKIDDIMNKVIDIKQKCDEIMVKLNE